jgi:hypothetical protein
MLGLRRRPAISLLALLALCLCPSRQVGAQVVVNTDFDLRGWNDFGKITLSSDQLPAATLHRAIDGSRRTMVSVKGESVARFVIDISPPQYVSEVGLRPGPDHDYEVVMHGIKAGGNRYAFGTTVVGDGDEAISSVNALLSRIEFTVENLQRRPAVKTVEIAEVRVAGNFIVVGLNLAGVPEELPEGGEFPMRVLGEDKFSGRPDLTEMSELNVTPPRALRRRDNGNYVARIAGAISIVPQLEHLTGERRHLLVRKLLTAPDKPVTHKGFGAVELYLAGNPPFEVYRRDAGDKEAHQIGKVWSNRFIDDTITNGKAYHYSVKKLDRFGNPATALSKEQRVRTVARLPSGHVDIGRLPVLVVLYTDSMEPGEPERIHDSLEAARKFLFIHSAGKLLIDNTYLSMAGPTPDTRGPSMHEITAQLEAYGVPDDSFGMVYAVANDLSGGHGNFEVLGSMGGAMGRGPGVPTPPGVFGPDPDVAWAFLHELNHVLAGLIASTVEQKNVPSGHFAQDFRFGPLGTARGLPMDVGEGWDGLAALARNLQFWDYVVEPYRQTLVLIDSDGDGLPDRDARVPVDESRFGSDPNDQDSDDDGLSDADELRAGLYEHTDPRSNDTDRDGLLDGNDPWPLSNFTGVIPYGDTPVLLATGPRFDQPKVRLAACWNEEELTLQVTCAKPSDIFIDIDGSGSFGRWESDVIVTADGLTSGSDVWAGPSRISVRAHFEPRGIFIGSRQLIGVGAQVQHVPKGSQITVRLPAALGPGDQETSCLPGAPEVAGLRLEAGTVLGLAITIREARQNDKHPFDAFAPPEVPGQASWYSLFETHRLMDAKLVEPPGGRR